MSGIAGIVNLDGAPVDRRLLESMSASIARTGPDAQQLWADGPVGLCHAMLRTTWEAEIESQPHTLDGGVWITADARVDSRPDLVAELTRAGRIVIGVPTDADLLLHAYHAWGNACVEHIIGDFAFAIWDGPRRRLFCAHDHFGVKPFYYARVGNSFVFSNVFRCVHMHPTVS